MLGPRREGELARLDVDLTINGLRALQPAGGGVLDEGAHHVHPEEGGLDPANENLLGAYADDVADLDLFDRRGLPDV
jgi:hypothetical protein